MPRRSEDSRNSPSVRGLVRKGIVVQVGLSLLILAAIVFSLVPRLSIVKAQERDTRAIGELRDSTLALLGTIAAIDRYAQNGKPADRDKYRAAAEQLRGLLSRSTQWLDGKNKAAVLGSVAEVDRWQEEILEHVVRKVERGDRRAAQDVLLDTSNDQAIATVALPITTTMDELVKIQLADERSARTRLIVGTALIGAALLLLIGAALAILLPLRRRVVQPLEDIAEVSTRISEGDFAARAHPQGVQETQIAAAAFNQMADRVEHHIDEYKGLDDLKDQFVASASHELRTPITSIQGYVDMQLVGEVGEISEAQRANLEVVRRNAAQLSELIEDLLTLSTIRLRSDTKLELSRFSAESVLREVITEVLPQARASGVKLELRTSGNSMIEADRTRLRRVFLNLATNAIKFSPREGAVRIEVSSEKDGIAIAFIDSGVGISADDLPKIGSRFFRAETAQKTFGTGLGLSIARELIEQHGGTLDVESELGVGSTFTVRLPRAQEQSH